MENAALNNVPGVKKDVAHLLRVRYAILKSSTRKFVPENINLNETRNSYMNKMFVAIAEKHSPPKMTKEEIKEIEQQTAKWKCHHCEKMIQRNKIYLCDNIPKLKLKCGKKYCESCIDLYYMEFKQDSSTLFYLKKWMCPFCKDQCVCMRCRAY